MSVGGVGRGGGKGRAGGAKGASGAGPAKGSSFGGKVDGTERLVGPSGAAGSSNVGGVAGAAGSGGVQGAQGPQAADPVTASALAIAKKLKNGDFKSKDEATRKLVAEVLKEKLQMKSVALTQKIADALQDDPRLNQALERLWAKAE